MSSSIDEQFVPYLGRGYPPGQYIPTICQALGRIDPEQLFRNLYIETTKNQSHDSPERAKAHRYAVLAFTDALAGIVDARLASKKS